MSREQRSQRVQSPRAKRLTMQALIHLAGDLSAVYRDSLIKEKKAAGYTVFYLPLMSSYRSPWPLPEQSERNLSSLLLGLESGAQFGEDELAALIVCNPEGTYLPVGPSQVDDLRQLSDEALRHLLRVWRRLLLSFPPPVFCLIDCDGLAWRQLAIVASLCDVLALDPPAKMSAVTLFALQDLLGNLPPRLPILSLRERPANHIRSS